MGDFHPLAVGGEQHGVIADHIASTHGGEANGFPGARAGLAFAAVHCHLVQITPQCLSHHLAHAQGGAGRRIDLVPVMGFDDLDIHFIAQHPGGGIQQFQAQVDADAEVGGKDDGDLLGRLAQQLLFFRGEAGGADHHGLAGGAADLQVLQGHRGVGEIDQHIELINHRRQIAHQGHANLAQTGQLTGIGADQAAVGPVDGGAELRALGLADGLDQGLAHAPSGAHYCDTLHSISSKLQGSSCKPSTTPSCGL